MGTFEEEQKRRAAAAKARGWDDATIQKYQLIDRIQQQRQQPVQQQAPQEQKKGPSGLKRFLVNTGAIAGSIGAGIGSLALAPVTGGASLAGGFAAGAGIEALRRKALGEKQNIAASALEGGLTILPGVAKGLKGLTKAGKVAEEVSAASKAAKVVKGANVEKEALKNTLMNAFKTPEGGGRLTKVGSNIRAEQRGIQAGEKVVGGAKGAVFNDATAAEVNAAVSKANKGIIPKGIRGQVRGVQAEKEAVGQAQKAAAQASKATVNKETQAIMNDTVSKGRQKILDFDSTNEAHAKINNRYAERLANAKTPEQLLEQRKIFDTKAKATFLNPSVEQTIDKELAGVYRQATDKAIAKLAPEVKTLDKQFSLLTKAENTMTAKSSRLSPSGIKLAGTSVNGKGVGGSAIQATKEGVGKTLEVAGKVTGSPIVKTGIRQGIARGVAKPYLDQSVTDPNTMQTQPDGSYKPAPAGVTDDTFNINDLSAQFEQAGITDPQQMFDALSANEQPKQTQDDNPLGASSAELFNQALQEPDPKRRKELLDFSQVAAEFETSAQKSRDASSKDANGLNVTKPTSEKYAQATSGANALGQLRQLIEQTGGVPQGTRIPGQGINLFGIGSDIKKAAGTGEYDTLGFAAVDNALRIATGAAAPDSEIRRYMDKYLPKPGDDAATIKRKLDTMEYQFASILKLAQPDATNSFDINTLFNQQGVQ